MYKHLLILLLCLPLAHHAQTEKKYQGLLWKISGNGLQKPSYLYGTMHVSNRVAFHLSESFFRALDSVEVIALETNPEYWIEDISNSELFQEIYATNYPNGGMQYPLYSSFIPQQPLQNHLAYYLARDQDMLNGMLWRFNQGNQDFEENTFLDLFIYQAGKKKGKKITALEDFEDSFVSVMKAGQYDKDAKRISDRQARDMLGDFSNWTELQEDAYRKGDLNLLDTIMSSLNPGKYHHLYMLDIRNRIMAQGMDSLMKLSPVFTGVGAAHLPGKSGVINLLREMGYTVVAADRTINDFSMEEKEIIDTIYYRHAMQPFSSEDGFIQTRAPGMLTKVVASPHQEYLFADMANGAFYSIKRIPTFAPIYGKSIPHYQSRIDSLLFENIPGKILQKNEIEINGYRALEINNETRKGDKQKYLIIFTPLELILMKAGGHKDFVKKPQPQEFFNALLLNPRTADTTVSPPSGIFQVKMPQKDFTANPEGIYYNPFNTYWQQSQDADGNYFAAAYRHFYDFDYIEEDQFELEYFLEKIEDEDKLRIDSSYSIKDNHPAQAFRLKNQAGEIIYGEIHIHGPHYVMLWSNAAEAQERQDFFRSFRFSPMTYQEEFALHRDSSMHIQMVSPQKLNNYSSFIDKIYNTGAEENPAQLEEVKQRLYIYRPTGEQLEIEFIRFHKYLSYENAETFWEDYKRERIGESLILLFENQLSKEERDSSYYKDVKEFMFSDTASSRRIWTKVVLENGAAYRLTANINQGEPSQLISRAFESFDSSGDTLIGLSILHPRSDLFFKDLSSGDSSKVYEAKNSIYNTTFTRDDSDKIKWYVHHFRHEDFKRDERLQLLNRLAFIDEESNIDYLSDLYYDYLDSASYQFAILEALADFETKRGNRQFVKLILDETPFSSNSYGYSNLIYELDDSIQLLDVVFPDLLELTDFEDYKPHIYGLLSKGLDSNAIEAGDYKRKYQTILRYAKVELKKQKAQDEGSNNATYNSSLNRYVGLLRPFARKREVRELYQSLLTIRNKAVLLDQLTLIHEHIAIPDSIYNFIGSDEKARKDVYQFLWEKDQLPVLKERYRNTAAVGLSLAQNESYRKYDTIAFMESQAVEVKGSPAVAYFYRARNNEDKLWKLIYVVMESREDGSVNIPTATVQSGESFNLEYDKTEEIIEDALKEIRTYGRQRVVDNSGYY